MLPRILIQLPIVDPQITNTSTFCCLGNLMFPQRLALWQNLRLAYGALCAAKFLHIYHIMPKQIKNLCTFLVFPSWPLLKMPCAGSLLPWQTQKQATYICIYFICRVILYLCKIFFVFVWYSWCLPGILGVCKVFWVFARSSLFLQGLLCFCRLFWVFSKFMDSWVRRLVLLGQPPGEFISGKSGLRIYGDDLLCVFVLLVKLARPPGTRAIQYWIFELRPQPNKSN